jgi:hypothetical protein
VGDSIVSANPIFNGICLNPLYSIISTVAHTNIRHVMSPNAPNMVRQLLGTDSGPNHPGFPLLRESAGTAQANGKNVVIFILESWRRKTSGISRETPESRLYLIHLQKKASSSGSASPPESKRPKVSFPYSVLLPTNR